MYYNIWVWCLEMNIVVFLCFYLFNEFIIYILKNVNFLFGVKEKGLFIKSNKK